MRVAVYALFLLSGITGLVYEVLWGKYFALFFGSTSAAHTIVLTVFMAGLAAGNVVIGRRADASANRLALYGYLELAIGGLCLLFPTALSLLSSAYWRLASPDLASVSNLLLKGATSLLLILPVTFLMGGTLPVLSRYLIRDVQRAGTGVGLLYSVNSIGAALGCLIAGLWLVATAGLDATMRLTAVANLLIGAACVGLALRSPEPEGPAIGADQTGKPAQYTRTQQVAGLVLVGVTGVLSMVFELVWIRLLSLVMGSSTYSFSLMLFAFIGGIAIGGAIASALLHRNRNALLLFAACETAVCLSLWAMLPLYERLPYLFHSLALSLNRAPESFGRYLLLKVSLASGLMLIPTTLIGMTLPLISSVVASDIRVLGRRVGSAFAVNTTGNVVGTLLAGFVLIPALGLQRCMESAILATGVVGAVAWWISLPGAWVTVRTAIIPLVTVAGLVFMAFTPRWSARVLNSGMYRVRTSVADSYRDLVERLSHETLLYHRDGPEVSVAVGNTEEGTDHLWLNVNGKTDASTDSDMGCQLMLAHLPLSLRPSARRVMIVGLGSGITAGAALRHPIDTCDVVEISPAVVHASRFFDSVNGRPLEDPRTRLSIGDAREHVLLQSPGSYDVVISEPSNPWIAGMGNLFSVEFFEAVASRLRPGGMLTQWLHMYEMDDSTLAIALNTLSSVFPEVTVWNPQANDILMVASMEPVTIDTAMLSTVLHDSGVLEHLDNGFAARVPRNATDFLSLQVLSPGRFRELFPGHGQLNRDRRPVLEYRAPRAFFTGAHATLMHNDERLLAPAGNGLLVAPLVTSDTMPARTAAGLIRLLSPPRHDSEKRILRGLAIRYLDRDSLEARADSAAYAVAAGTHLQLGTDSLVQESRTWDQRIARGDLSKAAWRDYFVFESQMLQQTWSLFYQPDTVRFSFAFHQCTARYPLQEEWYRARRTALMQEIGIAP